MLRWAGATAGAMHTREQASRRVAFGSGSRRSRTERGSAPEVRDVDVFARMPLQRSWSSTSGPLSRVESQG